MKPRSIPRVALISNLCPHYRRPLYEVLARRFELECYFFATDEEYWNPMLPAVEAGDFTRVELRPLSVLGEPVLPALASRLTRDRYDVVIMDLTGRLMIPYVYFLARMRRLPFVLWTGTWLHPDTRFHRLTRGVTESLYRRSDAILVYGDHVRRALTAVRGVEGDKIFTVGQAVVASRFAVATDPARSNELLFVGQFEEHKGIDYLIAAFDRVRDPRARLILVGNGSLEATVRRQAETRSRIEVVGHVSQDELPQRYGSARALVLPSVTTAKYREAWGLVVNEAMHAGLPVIASDAVGAAAGGLVEDGVTGLVVPERDSAALGAAIDTLFDDDALVTELGRQARERVSRYTFDRMADAFEAAVEHASRARNRSNGGAAA